MSRLSAVTIGLRSPRWTFGALVVAALSGAVLVSGRPSWAEPTGPAAADKHITHAITVLMNHEHLTRHPLDNEISGRWLDNYLKMLDPRKVFFTESDVDNWMAYRSQLDDMALRGDTSFAYRVFGQFLERIDERVKLAKELVYEPHDFVIDEAMDTDADAVAYAKNDAEMRDRWRKRVKFELLDLEVEKKLTGKEAQEKIAKRYQNLSKRMRQTDNDELLEMYLTALTTAYDPHTAYMSPSTLENFEIQMRLNLEGIGAALEAPDGETVVKRVIPGGAAAKDGRLKMDDRIIGVGQGIDGPIVDVSDMKLNDVVKLIRGHQGTTVRLQVVPEGEKDAKIYAIERAQVALTDSEARSVIFEAGKKANGSPYKVGVINLPSFYMDMEAARSGRDDFKSTTRDVAGLLEKFKAENVDAVVLDLHLNGGGSLTESINLTGLFIDTGPVVQVKDIDGQKTQYDDTERGLAWSGPLVVLTSKFSASASEIFAGAIQDYKRGIVVGDTATHGKGTVQSLLDLSQKMFRGVRNAPQLGALKITMQQFYRPDGDSTQNRGVLADIVLPSLISQLDVGESSLDYAMKFDHVDPAEHSRYSMVDDRIVQELRKLSGQRRDSSGDFQKLTHDIERFNTLKDRKSISLNREKFIADKSELTPEKQEEKEFEELNDPNRPVVKRDYYFNEVLDITADYARLLAAPQAAAVER
ncbi:MAG: carboxy terminal-processing peptidase [Pirellulales bacterium]